MTGQVPRPSFGRMVMRALLLRCPRCGSRGIMANYFNLKHHCPTCELVFNRGESSDYWMGGWSINFIISEAIPVLLAVVYVLATLPDVPWGRVGLLALIPAVIFPILFFPFSRTLWLALDLMARPNLRGDRYRYRRSDHS